MWQPKLEIQCVSKMRNVSAPRALARAPISLSAPIASERLPYSGPGRSEISIDGTCAAGSEIHLQVQLAERSLTYTSKIQTVTAPSELAWREEVLVPGLLDGEHRFALETTDSGQTRFVQHDTYSGALVPLVMGLYQAQAEFCFRRMNNALKKRAEQQDSSANGGL